MGVKKTGAEIPADAYTVEVGIITFPAKLAEPGKHFCLFSCLAQCISCCCDRTAERGHIAANHIGNLRETAGQEFCLDTALCRQRVDAVVRLSVTDNHDFQSYSPSFTSSFP